MLLVSVDEIVADLLVDGVVMCLQTVVLCGSCSTVLCTPTGGRARLTEGRSAEGSRVQHSSAASAIGSNQATVFLPAVLQPSNHLISRAPITNTWQFTAKFKV